MTISVVTVCYNSAHTLEHTLCSVADQSYGFIEHIVIDGASTDNTLDVLTQYGGHVAKLVSEKDGGIYDAMNKGIALATADIIGFINSDDFYPSSDVLLAVSQVFENQEVDACYGDLCYVKQEDTSVIVRYWKSSEFFPGSFESGWCPPHPTFFVRRSVYERLGGFNIEYKIASDIELMMRFMEVHKIRTQYLPKVLVHMRMGGTTNRSISNIVKQNWEVLHALESCCLRASVWRLVANKLLSRGLQFFRKPEHIVK